MHHSRWMLALLVTVFVAACAGDSPNPVTPQNGLDGTWSQVYGIPGVSTVFTLAVSDTVIVGVGNYTIEAGRPGTVQVSGAVSGTRVRFDVVRSDGTTEHVINGALTPAGTLAGAMYFSYTGQQVGSDPAPVTFQRAFP